MSKRRGWWYHTRDAIRAYPDRKEALRQLRKQGASKGSAGGRGEPGRSTEKLALRTLPPVEQKELEAVELAVARTKRLPDGKERLRIIEMVHWKGTHTLSGAALAVHVSESTAKRWQRDLFLLVARECGFVDREDRK